MEYKLKNTLNQEKANLNLASRYVIHNKGNVINVLRTKNFFKNVNRR